MKKLLYNMSIALAAAVLTILIMVLFMLFMVGLFSSTLYLYQLHWAYSVIPTTVTLFIYILGSLYYYEQK